MFGVKAFIKFMKHRLIAILLLFIPFFGFSQPGKDLDTMNIMRKVIINNDTLFVASLPEVVVYPNIKTSRWDQWKYRRLIRNVKAAYPYSKIAGNKLRDLDLRLASMQNERQKRQFIDKTEKELKAEFEDQLKKLTVTQGRILIKLVYRETGNTTYEVVQDVKGNFSAGFWQTVARIFGSNLKTPYNPETDEEDKVIEHIIQLIEMGMI
jgi:hypothetical protein